MNWSGGVKIHVNGCPNACGQHWIADIGLQGTKARVDGQEVDAYDFFVGGGVAGRAEIARRIQWSTWWEPAPAPRT